MGEVWAARSLRDNQDVAVKVLLERAARRPEIQRRFEREAEAASRIDSRHVCTLLDQGFTHDGTMFLVFRLLEGESLADRLRREGFLPFHELAGIFVDVLQGIADAHAARVLHRDLKPGNIFVTPNSHGAETAVILDFGVSKLLDSVHSVEEPSLTANDGTVGSFAYMAPEQVRGAARVDERADVYGAGAVAFRALAGRLPFEAPTVQVLAKMKLQHPAPTLSEATGLQWPRCIEAFYECALAKNPDQRYPSASHARAAMLEVIDRIDRTWAQVAGSR
jgi:serine/threonine-protein kinase